MLADSLYLNKNLEKNVETLETIYTHVKANIFSFNFACIFF